MEKFHEDKNLSQSLIFQSLRKVYRIHYTQACPSGQGVLLKPEYESAWVQFPPPAKTIIIPANRGESPQFAGVRYQSVSHLQHTFLVQW